MSTAEHFRNRIVRREDIAPDQLLANPYNWRIHPAAQQQALEGVLSDVGFVAPVIVNERTGHVIDGHLRITLAMRNALPTVPVDIVDVSEEEERLILATLDPIGAMAVTDKEMLTELLAGLDAEDERLAAYLLELAEANAAPLPEPPDSFPALTPDGSFEHLCPRCGFQWNAPPQ